MVTGITNVTADAVVEYTQYFSGQYVIEDTNNPGNNDSSQPPEYFSIGTMGMCDAATDCANMGGVDDYFSFDLHYLASNATWECVLFYNANTSPNYFNVSNLDACLSFGFSS